MPDLRKDKTVKQGPLTKIQGGNRGIKANGKVRTQDTGKAPGGVTKRHAPIRRWGKGV